MVRAKRWETNISENVGSLRRTRTARSPLAKGDSLHDRIDDQLFQIRWNPALVRSFFKAEDVSYIKVRTH